MEEKKERILPIIVIGILVLIITSFACYMIGIKTATPKPVINNDPVVEKKETTEINNKKVIEKLQNKIDTININNPLIINNTLYKEAVSVDKLTEKEKIQIVEYHLFSRNYELKEANVSSYPNIVDYILEQSPYQSYNRITLKYANSKEATDIYKSLFGENIENIKSLNIDKIVYLEKYDMLIDVLETDNGCSNGCFYKDYKYYDTFEEDDNYYYVTIRHATTDGISIYRSFLDKWNNNPFYTCPDNKIFCDSIDTFKIISKNKDEFEKFKITFKKSNNDFYLEKIEREM